MGLDQYLYAEVKAPKDSPLFAVVEEKMTAEHRKALADPEDAYAYVSGWAYKGEPEALYTALCTEMRFTPHEGSPHFDIMASNTDNSYLIAPTIYYWRKANAIHRWFVEYVQNGIDECQRSFVRGEMLMDLIDRIERISVADEPERTALARELLPTQAGFFFGSTDYDEWYYEDIKQSSVDLRSQVNLCPKPCRFYYRASW